MFDGTMAAMGSTVSPRRRRSGQLGMLRGAVHAAWRRWRSRQAIAGLDAAALRDIGVSYAEAEAEANKPFWCE